MIVMGFAIFCIASFAVAYAGDYLWLQYRMRNVQPTDPFESVTFYYGTAMKNGKVEVFYGQPQTQTCVHALFPHASYTPCWYFKRSGIKLL
jgi:hypothetical protein